MFPFLREDQGKQTKSLVRLRFSFILIGPEIVILCQNLLFFLLNGKEIIKFKANFPEDVFSLNSFDPYFSAQNVDKS